MDSINFVELQAPFPQTETKTFRGRGNTMMTYITARAVMNRLDRVVGPENWRDEYQEVHGGILCTLYLRINGEWVGKSDVGTPPEKIEVVKGMYSDALKRAAVRWGIGRELYKEGTAFEDDDARTIDGDTGEVTRSEARPTTRGERSTHNPPKPSVADELPPAAAEQVAQELPLGTPRPEDVWVLSKTLYTKTAATMPKGVNWGFQVYEGAKKLGYADEEAVRAVVGVKSLNDWDKTLGELLNTLIDNAPTLAEAA